MKQFLRLEQLLNEEQLQTLNHLITRKYKTALKKFNTSNSDFGQIATHQAIFKKDGCTIQEKYCKGCIEKQCHIKGATPDRKQCEIGTYYLVK